MSAVPVALGVKRAMAPKAGLRTAICLQVDNSNPGDSISGLTARGLFLAAVENVIFDSWFMKEEGPFDYERLQLPRFDYSLVLCTPWIWDGAQRSIKYKILADFVKKINPRKRLALGVGSSYLLHYNNCGNEDYVGQITAEATAEYWTKLDKIICRDRLAYFIFSKIVPEHKLLTLPCPSFYVAQVFAIPHQPERDDLLTFCMVSPDSPWGLNPAHARAAMAYQDELVGSGIDTLTILDRDRRAFIARYGRPPTHDIRQPLDIVRCLARYRKLTSGRVHACMPALSLGLATDIIPLDSRALTAHHLGAKPVAIGLERSECFAEPLPRLSLEQMCTQLREAAHID
jgi:hypothetical protein